MAIEKEVKIKITSDVSGLESGSKSLGGFFASIPTAAKVATASIAALTTGMYALFSAIEKGQAVSELSAAFDNLYGKTKLFANDGIGTLRKAVDGMISDLDLMRAANKAAQAGLDPKLFLQIASGAEKLGDAVGQSATEALNSLTDAFITGREQGLKHLGIIVQGTTAAEKYASAYSQITEKAKASETSTRTAGDAVERIGVAWENSIGSITKAINENQTLAKVLDSVATAAMSVADALASWTTRDIEDVNREIDGVIKKLNSSNKGLTALDRLFGFTPKAARDELEKQLDALIKDRDELVKRQNAAIKDPKHPANPFNAFADGSGAKAKFKEQLDEFYKWNNLPNSPAGLPAPQIISAKVISSTGVAVQQELEDRFQRASAFFEDIFSEAINGAGGNLEDVLMNLLKRFAVDFGSALAGSIAVALGGFQGSASGSAGSVLGQGLGSFIGSLIKGGGNTLGSLFTKGTAPAVPQLISATAGVGSGAVAGTEVAGTSLAATLGTAAIAGLVAVALPFALAGATKFFGKIFGGSQDPDELARRAFRDKLTKTGLGDNLSLPTVQGNVNIAHIDHSKFDQFFANKPFKDQAVALASPLSQVLTGGGKLGEDFANIFAQAIGNANNYNEVIINTLSLMGKLGLTAGEAKDQLKELFLDGKVSLDQFAVGVQNLNFIAQEDLVGPNSVADALHALATAVDNPRIQLKALELAFKEMSQLGITKSNDIYQYLMEKFGPGVADVFKALTDAGIDTWEEIKNASVDQLVVIFNALKNFSIDADATMSRVAKQVTTVFADSGTKAATEFDKATQPIIRRIKEIGEEAVKTGGVLDAAIKDLNLGLQSVDTKLGDVKTKAGGITGTIPNNEFRA